MPRPVRVLRINDQENTSIHARRRPARASNVCTATVAIARCVRIISKHIGTVRNNGSRSARRLKQPRRGKPRAGSHEKTSEGTSLSFEFRRSLSGRPPRRDAGVWRGTCRITSQV
ncbi:hypothetical protein PVAG01_10870 [Phlyctema vagabunda]|uniref:Uncharacterized protein n=1 Tax=Phlyctema vagabunda TaxID=108571 RepID=A0ABR4P3H3_9HELO